MVVEEEEKRTTTQLELFADNLPHKPYCTDEKGWLQVRKKATAIGKKYIQHNQPCMVHWLVYDYDRAGALDHIGQQQLPVPNIVATNPANGNSHLFYRLADPICTSDHARLKPMALLAKIDFVMTEKLEADAGYQGFISKNVLHKHWQVQEVNPNPWNLADFLDWIDLPKRLPKRAKTQGLGRNCTMFEEARWWAYSQVLGYRLAGDSGGFYEAVLRYCEGINESFPSSLNFSEVKATAKSIARWTLRKYTGSGSRSDEDWAKYVADTHTPELQAKRGKASGEARRAMTAGKQAKAIQMDSEGLKQAEIAKALGVNQGTVSRWLKPA